MSIGNCYILAKLLNLEIPKIVNEPFRVKVVMTKTKIVATYQLRKVN